MKIRSNFVSNSSSCSFTISKAFLTPLQILLIENHSEVGEWLGISYPEDAWSVTDEGDYLELYTSMDNFDMDRFLELIGVTQFIREHSND
jgi:hypothetical protein